jgi:hypothetical protein
MKTICLSLPDEQVRRLDDAAAQFLQSRSGLCRLVFEAWLQNPHVPQSMKELLAPQSPQE